MIQQPISTVCGSCGLYLPGHATGCHDVCTCRRGEPADTLNRLLTQVKSAHYPVIQARLGLGPNEFIIGDFRITDLRRG